MRKKLIIAILVMAGLVISCVEKQEETVLTPPEKKPQPVNRSTTVDLKSAQTYTYVDAPLGPHATKVTVDFDKTDSFKKETVVTFTYMTGSTYSYVIPAGFAIRKNSQGKHRVVIDSENTVWIQGQTQIGRLYEFVFFGNAKNNGKKIRPNSYRNQIRYVK